MFANPYALHFASLRLSQSTFPSSDLHDTLTRMNVDNMILERFSQSAWKAAQENPETVFKTEKVRMSWVLSRRTKTRN